jgi:hypothetical protein
MLSLRSLGPLDLDLAPRGALGAYLVAAPSGIFPGALRPRSIGWRKPTAASLIVVRKKGQDSMETLKALLEVEENDDRSEE